MNSIYAYIKKYAAMLAAQTYAIGPAARLIVETDEGVFGTGKGADLANLDEAEVEKLPLSVLPKGRQGIRAIVISQTPACQEWLRRGEALFPALDDMAQIPCQSAVEMTQISHRLMPVTPFYMQDILHAVYAFVNLFLYDFRFVLLFRRNFSVLPHCSLLPAWENPQRPPSAQG